MIQTLIIDEDDLKAVPKDFNASTECLVATAFKRKVVGEISNCGFGTIRVDEFRYRLNTTKLVSDFIHNRNITPFLPFVVEITPIGHDLPLTFRSQTITADTTVSC